MGTDTNTEYTYRISVWDAAWDDAKSGAGRGEVSELHNTYYITMRKPDDAANDDWGNILTFINDIRNGEYNQIAILGDFAGEEYVLYDNV